MAEEKVMIVNGYKFNSKKEYEKALEEKKVIAMLSKKLNLNNATMVLNLYNKIIEEEMFSTAIGLEYVRQLRTLIIKQKYATAEELMLIPVSQFKPDKAEGFLLTETEKKLKQAREELVREKEKHRSLIIAVVVLSIMVAVMIFIASTSNNINILNYETEIKNKYSQWEYELEIRENYIEELEAQYGISN